MALFKKKPDVITDRARALSGEIAALEAEIKRLEQAKQSPEPRLRQTPASPFASPPSQPATRPATHQPMAASPARDPIFEKVGPHLLDARSDSDSTPDHFNELGVRKYDLPALLNRMTNHFRGPSTSNPKLVSYLAAGGIHGLRPMRYEKRIARSRLLWMSLGVLALMLGALYMLIGHGHR